MAMDPLKIEVRASSTEELWRGRVEAWRRSGLTAEAFCEGQDYAVATLRSWSSRLRRLPPVSFVQLRPRGPVQPPDTAPATLVLEIGAVKVQVSAGFDPALLAAVVSVLRGEAR